MQVEHGGGECACLTDKFLQKVVNPADFRFQVTELVSQCSTAFFKPSDSCFCLAFFVLTLWYILRQLIAGGAKKMDQLFSRRQTRGANVATFLALLELVRGGRVTLGPEGELKMRRGRIDRTKEEQ